MKSRSHSPLLSSFRFPSLLMLLAVMLISATSCQETGAESDGGENSGTESTASVENGGGSAAATTDAGDKEAAKAAVQQLVAFCKESKYSDAAPMIVYRGDDEGRAWKSVCNWEDADEQAYVSSTCASIQVLAEGSSGMEFQEFIQETESEGTWNVWVTSFTYEDGSSEQVAFAMLKIDGNFALGDLD